MIKVETKRYTVSEKTKKQTNLYHLKRVYRALRSDKWFDFDGVIRNLLEE